MRKTTGALYPGTGWDHLVNDNFDPTLWRYGLRGDDFILDSNYLGANYIWLTILVPVAAAPGSTVANATVRFTDAQTTFHGTMPANPVWCWVSERCYAYDIGTEVVTPDPMPYGPPDISGIRWGTNPWSTYGDDPDAWDAINGPWMARVTGTSGPAYSLNITTQVNTFLATADPDPHLLLIIAFQHPGSSRWDPTIEVSGRYTFCTPVLSPLTNYLEITP